MNLDAGGQSTWFFIEIFLRCIYIYVCMFVCIYIRQIESQIMTNQQFAKRRRPVIVRAAQVDLIRPLNPAPHIVSIHELPFLYRNGAFTFNFFLNYLFFFFWKDKIWEKNDNLRGLRIDVGKQIFPPINHMPSKSLNVMSTNFGSRAEIALECNNKSTWCASILEPVARRPGYRSKRNHFF